MPRFQRNLVVDVQCWFHSFIIVEKILEEPLVARVMVCPRVTYTKHRLMRYVTSEKGRGFRPLVHRYERRKVGSTWYGPKHSDYPVSLSLFLTFSQRRTMFYVGGV
jgi:hypothetical protein